MARGFAEAGSAWLASLQRKVAGGAPAAAAAAAAVNSKASAPPFASTGPHGHRQRMRERLLGVGAASLADYELLEMLLFLGIPRGDTKPLAKGLINRLGSLAGVLGASADELATGCGLTPDCVMLLGLPGLAAQRLAQAEARDRPVLGNWDQLHDYFDVAMTGSIPGQLRVLLLDNRNRLLSDEVLEEAAGSSADLPRLATRRALELYASALVLMRVLPAGRLAKADLACEAELAARMVRAASPLALVLHDHLLIGGESWVSLRQQGLI